jgi:hypothetical protein
MRHLRIASALLLAASSVACAPVHRSPATTVSLSPRLAPGTPVAIVDSLSAQLVTLELARLRERVIYKDWAPRRLQTSAQIAAVQEQLLAVSMDTVAPRRVMRRLAEALDAREAALRVRERQLLEMWKPTAPVVRETVAEREQVLQRRRELAASLGEVTNERE